MARKGRRKKRRTHVRNEDDPTKKAPPKSFVFWRGQYGLLLKGLEADLRKVMQPYTASNLKESKNNQLKDFINIAGPLGVTQFLILTATEKSFYLRVAKVPRGPTLTLRIHHYSLMRDVAASQLRPRLPESLWKTAPLVVMNNFAGEEHLKLATVLFQNLFPAINVQTAKLSTCQCKTTNNMNHMYIKSDKSVYRPGARVPEILEALQRVVLLEHDKETGRIKFRHFSIRVQPSGVTKSVKQLVGKRQLPDLSAFHDVAEFLTKSGYGSESEGEEAASSRVTLAQDMGRGNLAARQSRVQLQELGPRMELEIMKAEEGICNGKVLYHRYVKKSAEEEAVQAAAIKSREDLREKRRRQQEENVRRKADLKKRKAETESEAQGSPDKKKTKKKEWWEEELRGRHVTDEDDDAEYYRQEVGEEPDDMHGLRSKSRSGKRLRGTDSAPERRPKKAKADASGKPAAWKPKADQHPRKAKAGSEKGAGRRKAVTGERPRSNTKRGKNGGGV